MGDPMGEASGAAPIRSGNGMARHKFTVGQTVDFVPGARDGNVPRGRYKVQRLLPSDGREFQYRVKHSVDGHERVLAEGQLTATRGALA
jgi:hypothetical protein